jgi:hypothetical protein
MALVSTQPLTEIGTRSISWGNVVKEKPTVGSPFWGGAFPSDRIPKATKDINIHFIIKWFTFKDGATLDKAPEVKNSCKLYQRILESFSRYSTQL